jgi:aspartyl-tRNA(Asn)/glutamyl-tRNA(Gln) amidotransferase subunit A
MHNLTLAQLAQGLHNKTFSSLELTQHFLKRIQEFNPKLNAFITVCDEQALAQAKAADQARAQGKAGLLTGIPIAQKDIFCTLGVKTSCGSKMLDNFISPYDATVVHKFNQAGCVMLGKTNMDEFAMGSSNETSFYGPVQNPWQENTVPGGSSGGSASAVAARLAPMATGTDTGGSIRQPAALTGITGLKPTYGRVSRYGMIAFASSLDQGGPMTRTAEDAALCMNVMAGFDPKDSTSLDLPVPDYSANLNNPIKGLRIGLPDEFFDERLNPEMAALLEAAKTALSGLGVTFKRVTLPTTALSIPAYYIIAPAECSSNLSRFDGVRYGHRCDSPKNLLDLYERSRAEGFGPEVQRRIMIGTYALSAGYYDAYYLKALQVRRLISNDFARAFEECDLIMGPTSPCTAFKIGEKSDDPVSMYLSDIYTIAVNLAGLPALSLPCGFMNNLPVGMQLIGPAHSEAQLLNVGHQYQQVTDFHNEAPGTI